MEYKYITENNLEKRQYYMYSDFGGKDFLDAYRKSRLDFIEKYENTDKKNHFKTEVDLQIIKENIGIAYDEYIPILDLYVKRYEVTKRLYDEYDENWKPALNSKYDDVNLYLLLSECCYNAYNKSKCAKYFSCMLKLDDTLLSIKDSMTYTEIEELSNILKQELEVYESISNELGVRIE